MQTILLASSRRENYRLSDLILMMRKQIGRWQMRARQRMSLSELDNRMLADIGVTPADRYFECNKRFWQA